MNVVFDAADPNWL
jgi:hypothetical protein